MRLADDDETYVMAHGEAAELQDKWATWSLAVEEHSQLVAAEGAPASGSNDHPNMVARKRSTYRMRCKDVRYLDSVIIAVCPVYYGWVMAALVPLSALLVSPAQVYCVGALVDAMQATGIPARTIAGSTHAHAAQLLRAYAVGVPRSEPRARL